MIYVFLADGFEECEALTPADLLRRAELEVRLVGVGKKTVTGSHGISVVCDMTDDQADPAAMEMLVLPGGMPGTLHLEQSQTVQAFIDFAAASEKWIAAICAAPSILGHKGLLAGRRAVCFPGYEEQLTDAMLCDEDICVDGRFVTARGMGVSTEFGLKLVEVLCGEERATLLKAAIQCRR